MAPKARHPMAQAARERIEAMLNLLEATIQRGMTGGIEMDIAMELWTLLWSRPANAG